MVWRVELSDKPEILWERPELERLCSRLEIEYELRERHRALDRKLELISRTAQTLLELLQSKRSLRVEWYIVALIVVEIILTLFDMFIRSN
jgi:required for meiotic nuclear division protein 1